MYVSAEPPSYDSMFGRIRQLSSPASEVAQQASRNVTLYLLVQNCCKNVVIPFCMAMIVICMIVIGSVFADDCPADPAIPIFLILGGKLYPFNTSLKQTDN